MKRYNELTPRLPNERYLYAILEQLVELNNNIKSILPEEEKEVIEIPIEEEVKEIIEKAKRTRRKKGDV